MAILAMTSPRMSWSGVPPFHRSTVPPLILAAFVACSHAPTQGPWHQQPGYRWREIGVSGEGAGFTRVDGGKTGITFQNFVSDSALLHNRYLGQGAGVALGDVDGDGLVDVFLARTEGCSALYHNLGGWKFEDVSRAAGLSICDRRSTGTAFVDIDGDNDLDLIVLATNGPNAVFVNDGKGHFTEHRDLGIDPTGNGGTTLTMADVDGDGRLDLYVANYSPISIDDSLPPQRRAFNQVVRQVSPGRYEIVPELRDIYKIVTRPDMGGTRMTTRGAPDDFYHNDGGRFTRVPLTSDTFRDAKNKALAQAPESFGLAAKFVDLNGDGAPDLYVTNDFEDTDELWYNDGRGHFHLADWTALRQVSNSAMGVDAGDVNGDGLPDLFEVDMLANDSRRLRTQIPAHTALPKKPGDLELELQHQRNSLLINRGDGTFADVGTMAGVAASGWSWSTLLMDVDLDGWQDILIGTGHLWDIMDGDGQDRLQNRMTDANWRRERWQFPKLSLKNVAFRNRGDMTFEDASAKWKFGLDDDVSHAMAAADLDGDGDLDVVVNRLGAPALVLRNDASAARVAVRLLGDAPNTRAVGARLRLLNGAVPVQEREVAAGGIYLSHSDYEASFAMGTSDSATLVVDWRDGRRTTIPSVGRNREYEIDMSTAVARPAADTAKPAVLFEDVTAMLGGHTHREDVFDDWGRQFLLPSALSQLGPGVAWFDVDRDGDEDLLIGTGKGGRVAVFRNDHGRLSAQPAQGPVAPQDYTSILGLAEGGSSSLVAGVSTWEARTEPEMTGQPAAVTVPFVRGTLAGAAEELVGSHESATGPLALGDYDGDGDLDLFVGSRAIPLRYPAAASSGLFKNEGNGRFVLDGPNTQTLRNVGLVSAAIFADVNGDGYDDLVLARDWGSILLLLNDGHGRFKDAPASWGLARWTSRWNGIAAGDLDGDGRLDLVATSWGRNTTTPADSSNPLHIVYGLRGSGGEDEMLLAREDSRIKGLAPLDAFARVRVALPDVAHHAATFAAYADATVDQLLGTTRRSELTASTMDHTIFLNRGDHFIAQPMPVEAQLAPAFYAGVADFNGDGFEDVFLSQNFFPTEVGTPRYDAGRSLLMFGDGKGGLAPLSGTQSGLIVYGDQRGAAYADYDGDGRLDLVVSQNGAATRLFHNRGAKAGLRVRLQGPPSNPDGIGAQIKIIYADGPGPVRELHAGSGYWSENGAVQVFGLRGVPTRVWVRWPGGAETRTAVPAAARELVIKR